MEITDCKARQNLIKNSFIKLKVILKKLIENCATIIIFAECPNHYYCLHNHFLVGTLIVASSGIKKMKTV